MAFSVASSVPLIRLATADMGRDDTACFGRVTAAVTGREAPCCQSADFCAGLATFSSAQPLLAHPYTQRVASDAIVIFAFGSSGPEGNSRHFTTERSWEIP
jgi:hypothetical protein